MTEISEDIIIQASEGDVQSFEKIYNVYSGFVYNVALRMVRDTQDAQEVTQEVFLTVYRKLKTFKFQSSLKTWLYRIAVNLSINHAKKVSKERNRSVEFDDNMEFSQVSHDTNEESREEVDALLNVLNPDQRACLILRSIQGLSYEQIAQTLNININTVRTRIKRAREKLIALKKEVIKNEL